NRPNGGRKSLRCGPSAVGKARRIRVTAGESASELHGSQLSLAAQEHRARMLAKTTVHGET
ncbi:MAG TPA: hypothetical protein VMV94_07315, partial [Phycisphaerae bacterium]|nr:hypothetical protein [Phycisphaerae bacterium]